MKQRSTTFAFLPMLSVVLLWFCTVEIGHSQGITLEGYTYESGNRGYIKEVTIEVIDPATNQKLGTVISDNDGHFVVSCPPIDEVVLTASKVMYKNFETKVALGKIEKVFQKVEMERAPGYLFEITLAEKKETPDQVVDAISGALIEVYNNTSRKAEMVLEDYKNPEFKVYLQKGSHYTILVRKEGYLAKQMEAFVNVKGCILCFEGINDVRPGVAESLTAGNEYGSLISNVELEKLFSGKSFSLNINYETGKFEVPASATKDLDKIVNLLRYNPYINLEIGAHTDSRGSASLNKSLSDNRANAVMEYLMKKADVPQKRLSAYGYGESKLKNKCADGVVCSEAEHQENRRTEVVVTAVEDKWIFKPLENIKNEEYFANMENAFGSGVKSGEDLAAEPTKAVDKQVTVKVVEQKEQAEPMGEKTMPHGMNSNETPVVKENMPAHHQAPIGIETIESQPDVTMPNEQENAKQMIEEVPVVEEKIVIKEIEPVIQLDSVKTMEPDIIKETPESTAPSVVEEKIVIKEMEPVIQTDSVKTIEPDIIKETPDPTASPVATDKPTKTVSVDEFVEAVDKGRDKLGSLGAKTTNSAKKTNPKGVDSSQAVIESQLQDGFKIKVMSTTKHVGKGAKLYARYPKIKEYTSESGSFWYLLDGYFTKEQAETEYKHVKVLYPDAKIVEFKDGKPLGN